MTFPRYLFFLIVVSLFGFQMSGCTTTNGGNTDRVVSNPYIQISFPGWISEAEKLEKLKEEAALRARNICGLNKAFDLINVESQEFQANITFSFPPRPQISQISGQIKCKDSAVIHTSPEVLQDISMRCQTDKDCPQGSSCRSKSGGGTECRTKGGVSVADNLADRVALACEKTSDCPAGMSCRSKVGGGSECRGESLTETNSLDESQNLYSTNLPDNEPSTNPPVPDTPVLEAQSRLALLIGNADYQTSPLANPVNDVRGMATALRKAGFTVIKLENLNFKQMREAVRDFGEKLSKDHVGFFYYSGHGVQVDGKNYLIPVNSDIKYEDEVASSALDAEMVLAKLESAKNKLNIVVLDACRDSPLGRRTRTSTKGLSNMNAASGTMIAFSTAPGQVALDGKGSNSPYTKHLINAIQKEGLLLEQVFKEVRGNVMKDTNGTQVPWENSSILGDFYFVPKKD